MALPRNMNSASIADMREALNGIYGAGNATREVHAERASDLVAAALAPHQQALAADFSIEPASLSLHNAARGR